MGAGLEQSADRAVKAARQAAAKSRRSSGTAPEHLEMLSTREEDGELKPKQDKSL